MKAIHIGDAKLPLDSYVISASALLGTKGSGKTYAAKGIAEQLLEAKVPIVVFDPIGRWRFLKVAGDDSSRPRGYKVVVAGGEQPDLPLTVGSAPEIVRAAIRENIPLVIDLYDRKLSKADWRRIVQSCFRTLLYENKGMRHIFLEEAAEFAPQKIQDGETYAEVEKLVRMGGNYSVGITLINQRSQEVNKAVLDLCDNLVLMRQRGSHAIDALEKWIDKLDPKSAKMVTAGMPNMKAGEAWVFAGSAEEAVHVHTAPINSFHPDRSRPQLTAQAEAARATDPADFVSRMSGELSKLIEESKASDPAALRKRIAELERLQKGGAPAVSKADLQAAEARGYERGRAEGVRDAQHAAAGHLKALRGLVHQAVESALSTTPEPLQKQATAAPAVARAAEPRRAPAARSNGDGTVDAALSRAERALLTVLAQHLDGRTKSQLSILSGYSLTSSSFANALSALRVSGYINRGEPIQITDSGLSAVGHVDALPSGPALIEHWKRNLGQAERVLLDVVVNAYPRSVSKEELSDRSGYSITSSSFANALSKLRVLELVNRGAEITANEALF